MRSALLLSGIVGGDSGKGGTGKYIDCEMCYEYYLRNVIGPNNCDVFIHSWTTDLVSRLNELYEPKRYHYEPQIDFTPRNLGSNCNTSTIFRLRSKCFSMLQSVKLKRAYEKDNDFRYDWLMIGRFDLIILTLFDFSVLNSDKLYAPNENVFPKNIRKPRWVPAPKNNQSLSKKRLCDFYFIGNSEKVDGLFLTKPEEWFLRCSSNIHKALWHRAHCTIGDPRESVDYIGYRGYDYDLYRWRICHSR